MQLKLVALCAFAAEALASAMADKPAGDGGGAAAAPPAAAPATTPSPANQGDLLRVLLTALPTPLLNLALTNQPAVSSVIASEFAAGVTEDWFKSLPTPVQQYLENQGKHGVTTSPGVGLVPTSAPHAAPFSNVSHPTGRTATTPLITVPTNTSVANISTITATATGNPSLATTPATTPSGNQTSSTAGAMLMPVPTAAVGAGLAGALGVIGLLAL